MRQFVMENGLTVILAPFAHPAAGVVVGACGGNRHDPLHEPGLHHVLEHTITRATRPHPSWNSLTRYYEEFANECNAETDDTTILVYCRAVRREIRRAVRLIKEIVLEPLITKENVEYENERLREEYGDETSSGDWIIQEFNRLMFHKNGVRGIYAARVRNARHERRDVFYLHRRLFVGRRLVLVVTGGIDPTRAEEVVRIEFASLRKGAPPKHLEANHASFKGEVHLEPRRGEKITCVLGVPTFGFSNPKRVALGVLRNHFSSRLSSRLSIRLDSVGQGYTSLDSLWFWRDLGYFSIEVSLFPEKFLPALETIAEELRTLKISLVARRDLDHAKKNIKVRARLRFGEPLEAGKFFARQYLNSGTITPVLPYLRMVHRVTSRDIRTVAREIFVKKRLVLVAQGPLRGISKKDVRRALRF